MDKNISDANKLLQIISNEFLELIILPTEQCNFRCTYCYEDFSIGKMNKDIVTGIKNLISIRAQELKVLKISWFGGEPLAAKDVLYEITEHCLKLKKQLPNLLYESNMTTNGYKLDIDLLKKLVENGITGYQISLDGPQEIHNFSRIRANGSGTFDKIWNNLVAAKNSDLIFKVILRIHVTPNNYNHLPRLLDQINTLFHNDKRFVLFFKAIENLGGPHASSLKVLSGKNKGKMIETLYQMVHPNIAIEKIEDRKPYICYAAQSNSLLIRANGRIGKCTVAFSDDRNDIGSITKDGKLLLDDGKLQPWIRGISNFDLKNLECPMAGMPKSPVLEKHKISVMVERA